MKADSNKFCTNCGSQIVNVSKIKSTKSNFGQLLDLIEKSFSSLSISTLVNIESGEISVRAPRRIKTGIPYLMKSGELAHPLTGCDECEGEKTQGLLYFVNCESCLRSNENYFWIKSGQGDGVYTVIDVYAARKGKAFCFIGMIVILVPTAEFTQPLVDEVIQNGKTTLVSYDRLRIFDSLEGFAVTSMKIAADGELYITDSSTGFDSGNSSYKAFFGEETTLNFYAFAEISPVDQNDSFQEERSAIIKMLSEQYGVRVEPSEFSMIPRVIVGLSQDWIEAKGFEAGLTRPDGEGIYWDWLIGHQDSHIEQEAGTAAWFNSKLNSGDDEAELSFLLLGAAHGDQDCITALKSSKFSSILDDAETVAVLLMNRDQVHLGNEIFESGDVKGWLRNLTK